MRAIITFHSIDQSGSVLSYPPTALSCLLAELNRCRVPIVDLDALVRSTADEGVALTFDDGMRSIFTAALPILRDFDVPAHLFLTTGFVGKTNRWPGQPGDAPTFELLSWPEIELLHCAGVRVDGHTSTHPDLRLLDEQSIAAECDQADNIIEQRLGRRPQFFAYPYGYYNSQVRATAGSRYRACLTTEMRPMRLKEALDALPRIDSYYLRSPWVLRDPLGRSRRLYLTARAALRRLKRG